MHQGMQSHLPYWIQWDEVIIAMFPLPLGRETLHELIGAKVSSGGRANEGFRKEKWVTADQRDQQLLHSCFLCCTNLKCSACWTSVVKTSVCPCSFCISQAEKHPKPRQQQGLLFGCDFTLQAGCQVSLLLQTLTSQNLAKSWEKIKLHKY